MIPYIGLDDMFNEIILEALMSLGVMLVIIGLVGIVIDMYNNRDRK